MTTPESTPMTTQTPPRRHDFDALRAFAMLLGIALHAGLSYAPIPWLAMDRDVSPAIGTFIEIVHGFRLPLFFIMSGYFGAMLLGRRGVAGFAGHRWKRIGLPLLLGTLTIVPAMWAVIIGGFAAGELHPAPPREWAAPADGTVTIWSAAAAGDFETVERLVRSGVHVYEPDGQYFVLPLAWAATGDHAEIVAFLLEQGADPNQRMGDENTPLHTACFFGAAESAALMLDAGADPLVANRNGETPVDSMRHEEGVVAFIANLLGVEYEFSEVEEGRRRIAELLGEQASAGGSRLADRVLGFLGGEVFMHLWFLWQLCWLSAGLVLVVLILRLLRLRGVPEVLVASPLCLAVLIPLTALTQSWQGSFGPDTSAAIIPTAHVLVHYAVFFGFGAVMHSSASAADRLGRCWWVYLPIAVGSAVIALPLTHDATSWSAYGIGLDVAPTVNAVFQSLFVWSLSFGLIGLARRVLSRPSARIRYISDSSYWLYVSHLPLILAGQFVLAYVPLPPGVEFAALTVVTTLLLLAVYQLLVRYTWIGRLLNGRRERPGRVPSESTVELLDDARDRVPRVAEEHAGVGHREE